ncbi:MAG: SdrD B-like domain-containing protein, partial [Clostridia bacterium]
GFVFAEESKAAITAGESNLATVFAYAKQGYFSVQNVMAQTGALVGGGEYAVLDAAGAVKLSFVMESSGAYRSTTPLPSGAYKLVQMRAAKGTLPISQPIDFVIGTYFGNESDLVALRVESQPVPALDQGVGRLSLTAGTFSAVDGGAAYAAQVRLDGLCNGVNNMPLSGLSVTLKAEGMRDAQGTKLMGGGVPFLAAVQMDTPERKGVSVQALDASGAPLGTPQPINGVVALPEGTRGVTLSYLNAETGGEVLPTAYDAGSVLLELRYLPEDAANGENAPIAVMLSADCGISYQYTDVDGVSTVNEPYEAAPVSADAFIPDGRIALAASVQASGTALSVKVEDQMGLPGDLPICIVLPDGARTFDREVQCEALLRMVSRDIVVVKLSDLLAGYSMPISYGDVTGVTLLAKDPCGLPKTEINPKGAMLLAQRYVQDPVLDTLFSSADSVYSEVACTFSGACHQPAIQDYSFVAATGSVLGGAAATPQKLGVVLQVKDSGIHYGAATTADGSFKIYSVRTTPNNRDLAMTLSCMLPQNAMSVETGKTGLYSTDVTWPTMGCHISYTTMCGVTGSVRLSDGVALSGVTIQLFNGSKAVAEQKTDAAGLYRFDMLPEGEYTLVASLNGLRSVQWRAQDGLQIDGLLAQTAQFSLAEEAEHTQAFTAVGICEVKGTVSADGQPVAGAAVALTLASGERLEQKVDASGAFALTAEEDGEAVLAITAPDGMAVTSIGGQAIHAVGEQGVTIALKAGATLEQKIELAQTSQVFCASSTLEQGQTVSIASMYQSATAQTTAEGGFRFENLPAGDYSVYVPLPNGKTLAADSLWRLTQQSDMVWVTISVQAGGKFELPELAFATLTSIEGCAYMDESGDLVRGETEQLMTGVPVALQRATTDGWVDVANTKTNEYGKYSFIKLDIGDYRVSSKTDSESFYVAAVGGNAQSVGESSVMCSQTITLRDGESSRGKADIALQTPAKLDFTAFVDGNADGAYQKGERGVEGVTVEALNGETALASGITDAAGKLTLTGLRPGVFTLRVTLGTGDQFTMKGASAAAEQSCVGGTTERTAISEPFTFVSGQTVTACAGVATVGSFSGKVFEDLNDNGIMDEGEPGVAGVVLHLVGNKTKQSFELTTDETGLYDFSGLPNDTYVFSATLGEGMLLARYSKSGGDLRSVFTGSTTSREFPVSSAESVSNKNVGVIQKGKLCGVAFLDLNYNGLKDEGEPGYPGVTLEVIKVSNAESGGKTVSAEDGSYELGGLRGGEYRLRAILPDDGALFTKVAVGGNPFAQREGRRENAIQPVTVLSGKTTDTLVGVAVGATISGTVFQDADYNGALAQGEKLISGVKVQLVNQAGEVVQSATSTSKGQYLLGGIMPGNYTVRFTRVPDYGFTRLRPDQAGGSHVRMLEGDAGVTDLIAVTMGQSIVDVNAGMLPSATATGILFHDANDNGLRDEGENGLVGVSVRLLSSDGEVDLTKQVGEDGGYFFDGVMPGQYTLTYLLPEHVELARVAQGGNTLQGAGRETTTSAFAIAMGEDYPCPLVGAVVLGSFEGYVYHDANASGEADANEERMAGAELTLTPDRESAEQITAASGADGSFMLEGLRPAAYTLTVKLPDGYIFSRELDAENLAFDTVNEQTLACSWTALTNRQPKPIGAVKPATIAGVVWLDENKDGVQGGGEALMSGLGMELVDERTSRTVKSIASTDQGFTFTDVRPGGYTVRFATPAQAEPANDAASTFTLNGQYLSQSGVIA